MAMRYIKTLLASSRRKLKEMATLASSSSGSGSHMEKTADATRLEMVSPATVVSLRQESPTVRGITLKIKDEKMEFRAGQWMDTFLPGVDTVGGFSICSPPFRLVQEGTVDLAVKKSSHPPADWFHQCSIGSEIFVRIGGDFFFDPNARTPPTDLLLIAGGIGINPLFSIFQHVATLKKMEYEQAAADSLEVPIAFYTPGRTLMLYSAVTDEELIFKNHLDRLCKENEEMKVKYFVTKTPSSAKGVSYGRVGYAEVCTALQSLNPELSLVYICGPASMIESMESYLLQYGVDRSRILYEKWW